MHHIIAINLMQRWVALRMSLHAAATAPTHFCALVRRCSASSTRLTRSSWAHGCSCRQRREHVLEVALYTAVAGVCDSRLGRPAVARCAVETSS